MVSVLEKEDFKRSVLQRLVYSVGKDTDFAVPREPTLMFAGLMSRWIMPLAWAASSASATCAAISTTSLS